MNYKAEEHTVFDRLKVKCPTVTAKLMLAYLQPADEVKPLMEDKTFSKELTT